MQIAFVLKKIRMTPPFRQGVIGRHGAAVLQWKTMPLMKIDVDAQLFERLLLTLTNFISSINQGASKPNASEKISMLLLFL
jgi:hypothetical protein